MQKTGVELAIAELQKETRTLRDAIMTLRKLGLAAPIGKKGARKRRRLSAATRRKMSEAGKKRWAARKNAKKRAKTR